MSIIGVCASVLTSTSLIPQVVKIIREKQANDISLVMLCTLFIGHGLWIYYGVLKEDLIIVVANSFAATVDTVTFILRMRFSGKHSNSATTEQV